MDAAAETDLDEATHSVGAAALVVWSDITCPWAHLAVHRLLAARRAAGLEGELSVDHRALPSELVSGRVRPKPAVDAEAAQLAELEPDAGWRPFADHEWTWPATTLPALEAVQAAKLQGPDASVALDAALRRAVFHDSRCISAVPVILDVAAGVDGLDVDELRAELRSGRPVREVWAQVDEAAASGITISPTVLLADGTRFENPGISSRRVSSDGSAKLVIDSDDPAIYLRLVERAMSAKEFD